MQHEFRFNNELHEVSLERTPKIWTYANHCAHPKEDGRVRIYFEDGTKAWAHVAKVGMQADKRSDILAPTSAYEKGEVVSKSAPNSHHSPSQAQPKPQTRSNTGGWCSGTKSM